MPRLFLSRNIEDEDGAPGGSGSGSGAEPEPERRAGGRGRGGGWIHPPRLLRGGRGGGGGAGSECFPRVDWVAVPEALRARRVSTGAGGDNRVAKMWKRRGISASSGYDRSHDLPPHPQADVDAWAAERARREDVMLRRYSSPVRVHVMMVVSARRRAIRKMPASPHPTHTTPCCRPLKKTPVTVANPSAGGRVGGGRPVGDEDDI
eukprot:SAG25_NODE_782_length_5356_cov_9.982880_6_plen_206_part_00